MITAAAHAAERTWLAPPTAALGSASRRGRPHRSAAVSRGVVRRTVTHYLGAGLRRIGIAPGAGTAVAAAGGVSLEVRYARTPANCRAVLVVNCPHNGSQEFRRLVGPCVLSARSKPLQRTQSPPVLFLQASLFGLAFLLGRGVLVRVHRPLRVVCSAVRLLRRVVTHPLLCLFLACCIPPP